MSEYTEADVDRGADALLQSETNGLCRLGQICSCCDCPAAFSPEWIRSRDGYARASVQAVLKAVDNRE